MTDYLIKLLKLEKREMSKPLTLIINQIIKSEIFPVSLKLLNNFIIKKGDINSITNY